MRLLITMMVHCCLSGIFNETVHMLLNIDVNVDKFSINISNLLKISQIDLKLLNKSHFYKNINTLYGFEVESNVL